MEDKTKKRWNVTYTKHIKQKRKVFHDGFLDLHLSSNKVKLLDDCEKLLECRILKEEEVVSTGQTLTFNTFLLYVGDPQGHVEPLCDSNFQQWNKKVLQRPRKKFASPSISTSGRKDNVEKISHNLSPSRAIIREFKKSKMQKYGAKESSLDVLKPSIKEWQVLYTTQVTQKAKKYHDGFLRLFHSGLLGRQIMLYDATRKSLDSRFLRKDEIIRSGESITFDTHLVDIEELVENQYLGDQKVQKDVFNVSDKTKTPNGHLDNPRIDKILVKESFQNPMDIQEDAYSSMSSVKSTSINKIVPRNKDLRPAHQILSILQKPKAQQSVMGSEISTHAFSTKELQGADTVADSTEGDLLHGKLFLKNGTAEDLNIAEANKTVSEEKPAFICSQRSEDSKARNIDQCHLASHNLCAGGVCSPDDESDNNSHSKHLASPMKMDECPNFDLGF
ncbi:hypothetical protein K2173_010405 [Erythroxylum novogranatense]|uniref:5'-3' DNA helicase ZGRF1-like N-terminal domain-containing protein n=1 Tax=Erythroxylum novogranatense TaxID=1862640 RepID=A0AAV8TFX9_9ROSI|nr:hypothetical protein K2173_010405 [Erythroxylum novogranatense]